jgi:hypothetical protein
VEVPFTNAIMIYLKPLADSFERFLDCKSIHPCFLIFYFLLGVAFTACGGLYLVYGSGNIIEPIMFGVALAVLLFVVVVHAWFHKELQREKRRQRRQQPPVITVTNPAEAIV